VADDAQHPEPPSQLEVLNLPQETPPRPELRKPALLKRLDALVTKPDERVGLNCDGKGLVSSRFGEKKSGSEDPDKPEYL